jgi:hypothetical protein
MGFVMCGCVCVCVGVLAIRVLVLTVFWQYVCLYLLCFGNTCACIYCVLAIRVLVFTVFLYCFVYVYFLFVAHVRTTATE